MWARWILDTIVPGNGELSEADAIKVQDWANKFIPGPGESNLNKEPFIRR